MATTINFGAPELGFGAHGLASVQVEITVDGVTTSSRKYYFNLSEFSAYVDSAGVNFASVHLGPHVINLSNGDYNVYRYVGVNQANPYQAVETLSEAVAGLS